MTHGKAINSCLMTITSLCLNNVIEIYRRRPTYLALESTNNDQEVIYTNMTDWDIFGGTSEGRSYLINFPHLHCS